ncbi:hypothetical protein [Paenibacillus xylanexedens]|nr:hypothetical protein [Paenibacillus xylanexedens]
MGEGRWDGWSENGIVMRLRSTEKGGRVVDVEESEGKKIVRLGGGKD